MRRLAIILLVALLVGCTGVPEPSLDQPNPNNIQDNKKFCSVDADCVAETCCHPKTAVNYQFAPNCSEEVCTLDCEPGTIDCGQGTFKCVGGQCQLFLY